MQPGEWEMIRSVTERDEVVGGGGAKLCGGAKKDGH